MTDTPIRNFNEAVLNAYNRRCAVTGLQLNVVQAVHILPVSASGSANIVQNGIALSPTYRVAFDKGLIYLDEQLEMRVNEDRVAYSESLYLSSVLGKVLKPENREEWPDIEFVKIANKYRGISS